MTPSPARRRALVAVLGLGALGAATALFVFGLPGHAGPGAAPVTLHGRDVSAEQWSNAITLNDAAGHARSLEEFRGKVVLLTFGYTHCPDVCPTTLAKFAEVRRRLGPEAGRVQGIFVTVDPERDTAALLASYVPQFDPSFLGLRGTEAQTDAATRAFHANYQITEVGGTVLVDHTASTYLIDPAGRTRLVAPYDETPEDLAQDVAALLRGA